MFFCLKPVLMSKIICSFVIMSKLFFCLKKTDLSLQNLAFSILITIFVPVHHLRLRAKVTNTND